MKRFAALLVSALVWSTAPPAARGAEVETLFTLHDRRLDELSGIDRGITSPGVFYAQNDSGDSARFFALDARTGDVLAQYRVPGARNVDWEDLAVAPDAAGTPSVWLADIGDNDAERGHVTLYRVDEPRVTRSAAPLATSRPDVWQLRYPGGAVNAESLAVTPRGRAYVVTKRADGRSSVYAVPAAPSSQVRTMRRVAGVTFTARASLFPAELQREATGAAFSRDGHTFVVRTYTDAYVWHVAGDLARALRARPTRVALPLQPQGEGVCIDDGRLVLDSEQDGSQVLSVALPVGAASHSPSRTPASSPASTRTAQRPTQTPEPRPSPSDAADGDGSDAPALVVRLGLAAVIALGVAGLAVRLRRRRQG